MRARRRACARTRRRPRWSPATPGTGSSPRRAISARTYRPEVAPAVILDDARRAASAMREVGCTELYVAGGGWEWVTPRGKTRRQLAGQITAEDALPDAEFARYAAHDRPDRRGHARRRGARPASTTTSARSWRRGRRWKTCWRRPIPAHVFLGPDTGHFAWAGDDPGRVLPRLRRADQDGPPQRLPRRRDRAGQGGGLAVPRVRRTRRLRGTRSGRRRFPGDPGKSSATPASPAG